MTANLRFVFTGGPGAGKTTTLDALNALGFTTVADSARAIIRNRINAGLTPRPSSKAFTEAILNDDINNYDDNTPSDKPVFFDRGVCDALGSLQKHLPENAIQTYLEEYPYNKKVFIFPAWQAIYHTDAERDHTFAHAVTVTEQIKIMYPTFGYSLIEVPPDTVENRISFILGQVDLSPR